MRCEARIGIGEGKVALCGKPATLSVRFDLPLHWNNNPEFIPVCGEGHANQVKHVVGTDLESYGFPPEVSVEPLTEF